MKTTHRTAIEFYLREAPLFAAIVRGVECVLMEEAGPFEAPVLDLGCGDGVFAAAAFRPLPDCGLDPSFTALCAATKRPSARTHCLGDATRLGFPEATFRTVVSNSVLEHIPDIEAAVAEASRVLLPGGRFVLTSPSETFGAMLLGTRALAGVGLRGPAATYARWFNGHSLHFHTDSMATWHERLERNSFRITKSFHYLTPASHGLFDFLHYGSAWRWLRHRFTGRWAPDRDTRINRWWVQRIEALTRDTWPAETGPYLYIDATKQ